MIGKTLAHYEIMGLIGKGGMGEVYRAHDTKLRREVALKVLPGQMSADPERVARFEREARTLATLQHANIASVYGFEEDSGVRFLVMELVEGEDLAARLGRGRLPADETVAIARQIAEGLEAAHERGIVHRDLKPANIKITPGGAVKILDFGLARAYVGDSESREGLEESPTITAAMTQAGTILGTAAYMSPEQAKGKTVDKRADIWAFGAILFEMLSGRRLFEAETISETLAGVLLSDIAWDDLPPDTPPSLRALMERCLQKDPAFRLRDIGEARIVLADPTASIAMRTATAVPGGGGINRRRSWPWGVAIVVALALGVAGGRFLGGAPEQPKQPALLFDIPDPTGRMVTGSIALSPDGEHLVYARRDSLGEQQLWIRRLDEEGSRPMQGTRRARFPFWSADGMNLGFFIDNDLYRANLEGSAVNRIATIPGGPMGGAWNQQDVILVGTNEGPVYRVPASGGSAEPITEVVAGMEDNHCWPEFLPDGEHFVFLADASTDEGHRLYVHSLDGRENKILEKGIRSEIYVDAGGALLWSHDGQLFAHPFDFARREFTGPQTLVQGGLQPFGDNHECAFTLSTNGVLGFQQGSDQAMLVEVALDGTSRELLHDADRYRNPRLSPDGRLLAFEIQLSSDERLIWVQDLARGTRTLISERGKMADSPAWSPDGQLVYYDSSVSGSWNVYRKRVYGGSAPVMLGGPEGSNDFAVMDCSNDGKWLLVGGRTPSAGTALFLCPLDGEPEWKRWTAAPSMSYNFARFSPDARWIAFESTTSGRSEIYVAPTDGGPDVMQIPVSVGGGSDAAWSRDGSKLYYRTQTDILMAAEVSANGDRIEFAPPARVMELQAPPVDYLRNVYDPAPDGASVIAFVATGGYTPAIRVRTGWRTW